MASLKQAKSGGVFTEGVPPLSPQRVKTNETSWNHDLIRPNCKFPRSFYQSNGIPHCAMCGEKARTGMLGEAICALGAVDCARLKNG